MVSGSTVTVKIADPSLPAASLAVAVHSDVKVSLVAGAVNTPFEKSPPFVQETSGPVVIPTLSVADNVDEPVPVDTTVKVLGLNSNEGAWVSGAGGAGGVTVLPFPPPPPQEAIANPPTVMTVFCNRCLMFIFFPHFSYIGINQI